MSIVHHCHTRLFAGIVLFAIVLSALGGPVPSRAAESLAIIAPRIVNPQFAEPGSTITAEVAGPAELSAAGWQARFSNDLGATWTGSIINATYADIDHGSTRGWRLTIRVPQNIAPELFDLQVAHADAGMAQSAQSVSIVPDLEANFYLLHMTDEHVRYPSLDESKNPQSGFRTADLIEWATPVVNLINPRFVVNSGDVTSQYDSDGKRDKFGFGMVKSYREAKRGYRVPSLITPGNHDIHVSQNRDEAIRTWEQELGQRFYEVRMGDFAIFGNDYSSKDSERWIEKAYAESQQDATVKGRLLVQHFTDWNAVKVSRAPYPTLALIGHLHRSELRQTEPYPIVMTIAAHNYGAAGIMEFERRDGAWASDTYKEWRNSSHRLLVGNNGTPNVAAQYDHENHCSASSNAVQITNKLDKRFNDGRVRFLMERGSYAVTGGSVLASYLYDDNGRSCTAVLVKVDIGAERTTDVQIAQTSLSFSPAAQQGGFRILFPLIAR